MTMPTEDTGAALLRQQNSERHRLLLAASSQVYGCAKQILACQMVLTVGGAVAASFVSANVPSIRSWTVLYAVVVSLLDAFVLERQQADYRKLGARIQELFDTELFGLDWNGYVAGSRPAPEDICEYGQVYLDRRPNAVHLTDWYPAEVVALPLGYASLVCQRSNCWWDQRLRRRYLWGLVTALAVLATSLTVYSLARELTVEQLFLAVLAPFWPALVWGIREGFRQHDAAVSASKLQTQVEDLWARCLQSPLSAQLLVGEMRSVQNEIYRGRATRPLIFDWVNWMFRSRHQQLMQSGAATMAARLRQREN